MATREATRQQVIRLLWEKQFEGTVWAGKFDMIRPSSLGEYGELADKLIAVVLENATV